MSSKEKFPSVIFLTLLFFMITPMQAANISIIGAGLSGLTCAYRLQQMGHDVHVYEASERSGGRVLTHYFTDGSYEELGGKFLNDGGKATYISALIREFSLEVEALEVPFTKQYFDRGNAFPFYPIFADLPLPNEAAYLQLQQIANSSNNLGAMLDRFFADHSLFRKLIEVRMRNYEGSPTHELSTHYLDLFWDFYKESYTLSLLEKQGQHGIFSVLSVKGGNTQLIQALTTALNDCTHYRQSLEAISSSNNQLILQFANGQQVATDYIILTIPVPLLKTIEISEDLLSFERRDLLHHLPYGKNAKILIPISQLKLPVTEFSYTEDAVVWFNSNHSLMTLYFGGKHTQFFSDTQSLQQIYTQELTALRALFPGTMFPPAENIVGIGWPTQPFFQGSYSNFGVEQFELLHERITIHGIPFKKIFSPLKNRIFFAGEATALDYPSTMEGAVESAERLCTFLRLIL